jgi:hypothetical protein
MNLIKYTDAKISIAQIIETTKTHNILKLILNSKLLRVSANSLAICRDINKKARCIDTAKWNYENKQYQNKYKGPITVIWTNSLNVCNYTSLL